MTILGKATVSLAVIILALQPVVAIAQNMGDNIKSEQAASAAVKPEKKVCRVDPVVGSRLGGKKICRTRAEWRELDTPSGSAVRDYQTERRANSTIGG